MNFRATHHPLHLGSSMAAPELIASVDDLDPWFESSHQRPVFLFKHSLTCPVSGAALDEYLRFVDQQPRAGEASYTLVEIQNARPVSAEITGRTEVLHESPQAILLRDGKPVWNASHWSIKVSSLAQALEGAA